MRQIWQRFLNSVLEQQGPLYGFMSNGKLVHIDTVRRHWIVRFASRPHRDRVEKSLKTGRLNLLLEEIMGSPFQMLLEMAGERAFVAPLEPTPAASQALASGARALPPPPARDGSLPPPPARSGSLPPPPARSVSLPPRVAPAVVEIPPEAEEPPPLPEEDPYAASAELPQSPDSPEQDNPPERTRRPASESSSSRPPAHQPLDAVAELFKGKVIRLDV